MDQVLMKGNEAIAQAAIQAGCKAFFGYPITPQNEIPEYMSRELGRSGGVFIQAESEIGAINMVYGAAGSGTRVMTSSSSPGIALKQEGITYLAGAELPCVIVDVSRGGPGLGSIQPSQGDYYMATRGGGSGDYRHVALAPASIQEAVDLVMEAFEIADLYRNPVFVLADGMIGQMMEPVAFHEPPARDLPEKDWITNGTKNERSPRIINSLYLDPVTLENHNYKLAAKYAEMEQREVRVEKFNLEEAEVILTAYGTTSRVAKNAIELLEEEGIRVGLIRPITLWPFPNQAFREIPPTAKAILAVEMSLGQMVDDVKIANEGRLPVHFYGRPGGMCPEPQAIVEKVREILGGER